MTRTNSFRARLAWAPAAVALLGASLALLACRAATAAADAGAPPAAIARIGSSARAATVGTHYAEPLRVLVRDAAGNPVAGATVSFALGAAAASASAGGGAGATFNDGSTQATALTDASGTATSPAFAANTVAGSFVATATVTGGTARAGFSLRNLAGRPASVVPGVAASASALIGARFPVRLAVSVTDAYGNPVRGAGVTFSAPAHGPSGRFSGRFRRARVRTDASGKAVAPAFRATSRAGGYVVSATVAGAAPAAFALVNEASGEEG